MKTLRFFYYVVLAGVATVFFSCEKGINTDSELTSRKQVKEFIQASKGGTLIASNSVKLIIPPNALPSDDSVFVGITGNEPKSLPNDNFEVIGDPITIQFNSQKLLKPIQLEFRYPGPDIDTTISHVLLFNGTQYIPMEYSVSGKWVIVNIDIISLETEEKKGTRVSKFIISYFKAEQTPPPSQMGIKKVNYNTQTKTITFETPEANSNMRILILIHGWQGSASSWEDFLPKIQNEPTIRYDQVWTFTYNSAFAIKENGSILATELKKHSNGAKIDIVAHSMGGLVARSALEQFGGTAYVNKLVTLGTPHKGAELAVLRYILGLVVACDDAIELTNLGFSKFDYFTYSINTQGFRDLNVFSSFIRDMKKLENPAIPYYVIACTQGPDFKEIIKRVPEKLKPYLEASLTVYLQPSNDGIVTVSSAKGVPGAVSPDEIVNIQELIAHMRMRSNQEIYDQTVAFLRLDTPVTPGTIPTNGLVAYYPFNGNANDLSGNNNHGAVRGATLTSDRKGNANSAYQFDGKDDYIEINHSSSLNLSQQISISLWAKLKSDAHYSFPYHIIEKYGCWGILQRNKEIGNLIETPAKRFVIWSQEDFGLSFAFNRFYHFVMTYDGTKLNFYVDGILKASIPATGLLKQNTNKVFIGRYNFSGNYFFDGILDDIRIYNLALTQQEITALFNE